MRISSNQRGVIGPLEIVAIVVVIAVTGVLAWRIADADRVVNDTEANTSEVSTVYSEKEETIDEAAEAAMLKEASLEAVGNFTGEGTANRVYNDGTYTLNVSATLEDPADGKFYEGWLVTENGDFFSTGELVKANDGTYGQTFTSDIDYSSYKKVIITLETSANGTDGVPEDHVLEGVF